MRIGAGRLRGRTLRTPKGEATRPTSGMVRETLFNILAPMLEDARILDLYAGCGSVGLEAISRGAAHATLVEAARAALSCVRENIQTLDVASQVTVIPLPVERALRDAAANGAEFDIIFLDPPFADVAAYHAVLRDVAAGGLLAEEGLLIAQHTARLTLPDSVGGLVRYRVKEIGDNALSFYRWADEA